MATIVNALILCATDNQQEAENAVYAALNGGVFETSSSILDFSTSIHRCVSIPDDYEEGAFLQLLQAHEVSHLKPPAMPTTWLPC